MPAAAERRGRFSVYVEPGAAAASSEAAAAAGSVRRGGSPTKQDTPVVKRGRFLVMTCLPCVRPARTSSACDDEEECGSLLLPGAGPCGLLRSSSGARAGSSSQDLAAVKDQLGPNDASGPSAAAALRDASFSSAASAATCASLASDASSGVLAPARQPAPRRVRFSEPGCRTSQDQPATAAQAAHPPAQQQPQAAAAAAAAAPSQARQGACAPPVSAPVAVPAPLLRSYCRGRFVVQEALLAGAGLPMTRSHSVPEHCGLGAYAAAQHQQCSGAASSGSSSAGGSRHGGDAAALEAASQQAAHGLAAGLAAPGFWATTSAVPLSAALGGRSRLVASLSDEVVALPRDGNQQHPPYGQQQQHLQHLLQDDCGTFALGCGGPGGGLAAAAHRPPPRVASTSFFRRGRFLVQTTYT